MVYAILKTCIFNIDLKFYDWTQTKCTFTFVLSPVLDNIFLIALPSPSQYKIIHHRRPHGPGRGGGLVSSPGVITPAAPPCIVSQIVYKTYITIALYMHNIVEHNTSTTPQHH